MGFCQVIYETNFTTLCSLPAFINLLNLSACVLRYEADNDAKLRIFISCYVGNYPTTALRFLYLVLCLKCFDYVTVMCHNSIYNICMLTLIVQCLGCYPYSLHRVLYMRPYPNFI